MKLLTINFFTENYESITIDGKSVGRFFVGDLEKRIEGTTSDSIVELDICNKFYIEIYKRGDKIYVPYDGAEPSTVFNRLREWNDISLISFTLTDKEKDEKEYQYHVSWAGDLTECNDNQKSYLSPQGNLYIVVAKDEDREKFFKDIM